MKNHRRLIELLLDYLPELLQTEPFYHVPSAVLSSDVTIQYPLKRHERDYRKRTSLSFAAEYGYLGIVKLLGGFNHWAPDDGDAFFRSPLSFAAGQGNVTMVRLLLEKGASVQWKDLSGRSALSFAAEYGYLEVVKPLGGVNHWAPDDGDAFLRNPLTFAAGQGHAAVVRVLLEKGANVPRKDLSGRSALSFAAAGGHEAVVWLLLEKGDYLKRNAEDAHRGLFIPNAGDVSPEASGLTRSFSFEQGEELERQSAVYWETAHIHWRDQLGRTPLPTLPRVVMHPFVNYLLKEALV